MWQRTSAPGVHVLCELFLCQFVQLGWYGALRFGSGRIDIYSPATGEVIYSLLRIDTLPPLTPLSSMQVSYAGGTLHSHLKVHEDGEFLTRYTARESEV